MRKGLGKEAKLCYGAHFLMENRNGILIDIELTKATGTAEEEATEAMLKRQARKRIRPKTLEADKGYGATMASRGTEHLISGSLYKP